MCISSILFCYSYTTQRRRQLSGRSVRDARTAGSPVDLAWEQEIRKMQNGVLHRHLPGLQYSEVIFPRPALPSPPHSLAEIVLSCHLLKCKYPLSAEPPHPHPYSRTPVCWVYFLAWQLPKSNLEQHVEVRMTCQGKAGWHKKMLM